MDILKRNILEVTVVKDERIGSPWSFKTRPILVTTTLQNEKISDHFPISIDQNKNLPGCDHQRGQRYPYRKVPFGLQKLVSNDPHLRLKIVNNEGYGKEKHVLMHRPWVASGSRPSTGGSFLS